MAPRGELDTFLNDILDPRLASCKNQLRKTLLALLSSSVFCWVFLTHLNISPGLVGTRINQTF